LGEIYKLEPLNSEEIARWDELTAGFPSRELFHRKVWLEYLRDSRGVDIRYWAIRNEEERIGYFCGGILRKGPFKILGSPLKGWGTNFLGPVAGASFRTAPFLSALDRLASAEKIAMAEFESSTVPGEDLESAGYEPVPDSTFFVTLTPGDTDRVWKTVESTCRNRIRKAMKAGLTIEDTDDPAVADQFYDQYADLMRRKGLVPPYPREYPKKLLKHLKAANLILALRVRSAEGQVLATGLFPHDERTMYFWGGASWEAGRELCPNEFLHWSAIRMATESGLQLYNTCGTGQFKRKFGGEYKVTRRWHKCYGQTARWARKGYEVYFKNRIRLRGWWENVSRRRGGEAAQ